MLFLAEMEVRLPHDMPPEQAEELKAHEREYSQAAQRDGRWPHLWRVAGRYANVSVLDVSSASASQAAQASVSARHAWSTAGSAVLQRGNAATRFAPAHDAIAARTLSVLPPESRSHFFAILPFGSSPMQPIVAVESVAPPESAARLHFVYSLTRVS